MSLIPYKRKNSMLQSSPFGLIEDLQSDLNRFFNNSLINLSRTDLDQESMSGWLPSTDVHDAGDKLIVKTDLPGLSKEDIDISVQGNTLFIKGEKKHEKEIEDAGYLRSERFYGHFERAIPLGEDINSEKVDAEYKNGVLTVNIAKRDEAKARQVKVNIK